MPGAEPIQGRTLRTHRPDQAGQDEPEDLHADALGLAVMEARVQPQECAGADQRPAGPGVRLRGSLHPGHREDAGPGGVGLRGDDGHGAGQYQRGTRGADAVPGPAGSIRGYRVVERSFHPGCRPAAGSPGPPVACLSVAG